MESENAGSDRIHGPSYWDLVIKHRARNRALSWLDNFFRRREEYTAQLAVLEFYRDKVQPRKFTDDSVLEKYWQDIHRGNASNDTNTIREECNGRLYILEDLSSAYISALGKHFNLDPMLFVRHGFTPAYSLTNQKDLRRQPPWMLQPLFSAQVESGALTMLYYEVRELGNIEKEELMDRKIRWETCANVVRTIVQIDRDREEKPGLVRRNVTFWSRQGEGSGPWDALLIVDPRIGRKLRFRQMHPDGDENGDEAESSLRQTIECKTNLYLNGYLDFSPWPASYGGEEKPVSTPLDESSPFEDIIYYWQHARRADIEAASKNPTHSALFAMKIVASSWLVLLTFLSSRVGILETAVRRFEDLDHRTQASTVAKEIAELRKLMTNVNRLRRYLWWCIYHMKSNLEAIRQPTSTSSSNSQRDSMHNVPGLSPALAGLVLDDFSVIYERLLLVQKNIDSLMPIVMGANSLLETQQNSLDTKYVLRLTILALFFVPISSTTGLFSMAEKYLPGQPDSWIVASVCVPLLLVVFLLAFGRVVVEKLRAGGRSTVPSFEFAKYEK